MSPLWIEIPLALLALQRGWRLAVLLLVALPLAAPAAATTAGALAHGFALLGLASGACFGPAQARSTRPAAPLYQI